MYEILFKWGLETLREVGRDASKEELAFAIEAVKTKNALVEKRFDHACSACDDLVDLSIRIDHEVKLLQETSHTLDEKSRYSSFIGKLRNELHPDFLREYRKLKGRFIVTNDLLAGYALMTTEIIQYRQFAYICKSLAHTKISQSASLYRALWEHLVHLLSTMTRLSSSDVRFWLTDKPYMRTAEIFAAKELELARAFFESGTHGYYRCLLENPENLESFWTDSSDNLVDTYAQPSATAQAVESIVSSARQRGE